MPHSEVLNSQKINHLELYFQTIEIREDVTCSVQQQLLCKRLLSVAPRFLTLDAFPGATPRGFVSPPGDLLLVRRMCTHEYTVEQFCM